MERTFVMLKPDTIQRRLVGEIIARLEKKGLKIVGMKMINMTRKQAEKLYAMHLGKPFYEQLVNFVLSGPVIVMVIEGFHAIEVLRKMMGKTFGYEADAGTIRGDFCISKQLNIIHGSDSKPTADYEIPIFFTPKELISYQITQDKWLYESSEMQ
jgi:nucleoside-diphosphate kinase